MFFFLDTFFQFNKLTRCISSCLFNVSPCVAKLTLILSRNYTKQSISIHNSPTPRNVKNSWRIDLRYYKRTRGWRRRNSCARITPGDSIHSIKTALKDMFTLSNGEKVKLNKRSDLLLFSIGCMYEWCHLINFYSFLCDFVFVGSELTFNEVNAKVN